MKRLLFSIGLTGVVLMTACSNEESKDSTGEENAEDIEAVAETEVENTEEDAEKEKALQERENLIVTNNDSINAPYFEGLSNVEIIDFIELDHTLDNPGDVNITIKEIELATFESNTEIVELVTGLQNTNLGTEGLDYIENNDIIGLMTLKISMDSQLEADDYRMVAFEDYKDGIVRVEGNTIQNIRYSDYELENAEDSYTYLPIFITEDMLESISEFEIIYPNISSSDEDIFENKEQPLQAETIEFR